MFPAKSRNLRIRVHEQGDRSLDGMFRLIEVAEREQPLHEVLNAMCAEVAAVAYADVASIYVREVEADGPVFVMRGNVGFPTAAVGSVRLRAGEGITGFAAERLRPVSLAVAERDAHYKYIPGLGEERFPALLAVPVLRGGGAAGVLVLQRREADAFNAADQLPGRNMAVFEDHVARMRAALPHFFVGLSKRQTRRFPLQPPSGAGPGRTKTGGRINWTSRFSTRTLIGQIRWARTSITRRSSRNLT